VAAERGRTSANFKESAMAFQKQNGKQPYKHKTNRGSMFENDHKTKDEQPDFTGSLDVNGTIFWISGWKDMTQAGKKKISVSVKVQEERPAEQSDRSAQQSRRQASW
jgi:hypothetical protein